MESMSRMKSRQPGWGWGWERVLPPGSPEDNIHRHSTTADALVQFGCPERVSSPETHFRERTGLLKPKCNS